MGHVAHFDPGFPGYAMEIREDALTMGDLFQRTWLGEPHDREMAFMQGL